MYLDDSVLLHCRIGLISEVIWYNMYTFSPISLLMTENFCHEQCIIRNGILHYFSGATQVVNENVMRNVLSLTTRVTSVVAK